MSGNEIEPDSDRQGRRQLIEGRDFYLEYGLMVLTARYLEARGHCCESGCRHCPYSVRDLEDASE